MMLFRCQDAYQPEEIDEMMELGMQVAGMIIIMKIMIIMIIIMIIMTIMMIMITMMQVASYKCFQKIFNR